MKTSEAQIRANLNWQLKNAEHYRLCSLDNMQDYRARNKDLINENERKKYRFKKECAIFRNILLLQKN